MLEIIGDTVATKDHHQVTINDAAIIRKYDLQGNSQQHDDDYSDAPTISTISEFKKATISYIAGYVVGMVQKKVQHVVQHLVPGNTKLSPVFCL